MIFWLLPFAFAEEPAIFFATDAQLERALSGYPPLGRWCDVVATGTPEVPSTRPAPTAAEICALPYAPPGPPPLSVRPVQVEVTHAPLDAALAQTLRGIVRKNAPQLKYCYEVALRTDPTLSGPAHLTFSLIDGRVSDAHVTRALGDEAFSACLTGKVSKWVFPAGIDGLGVTLTATFSLLPPRTDASPGSSPAP